MCNLQSKNGSGWREVPKPYLAEFSREPLLHIWETAKGLLPHLTRKRTLPCLFREDTSQICSNGFLENSANYGFGTSRHPGPFLDCKFYFKNKVNISKGRERKCSAAASLHTVFVPACQIWPPRPTQYKKKEHDMPPTEKDVAFLALHYWLEMHLRGKANQPRCRRRATRWRRP